MHYARVPATWLVLVAVLLFGFVGGAAGTDLALDENATVEFQDPSTVAVDSALQTADGEVKLLVELPEREPASSARQLQAHARQSQADFVAFAKRTDGIRVENRFWLTNAVLVSVDTDRLSPDALARIEGVQRLRQNVRVTATGQSQTTAASRPSAGQLGSDQFAAGSTATADSDETTYGLAQIRATEAWNAYDTRGANTSVAVLDTGVDPDHPDITLTAWAEFDSEGTELDTEPQDYDSSGHGTHVSGTVAGSNASGQHIGVAPDTALYHGAVLTNCANDCTGTLSQIIAGMEWGVENNVDVLSMSLGANGYYEDFIDPVRNAQSAGTTVVAAIGNKGEGNSSSPANVYDAIAVGASDRNEEIVSVSSGEQVNTLEAWGPSAPLDWPDSYTVPSVAAPGQFVTSAEPGGTYSKKSGTSMATPHVAGAVALVQSATESRVDPAEMEAALEAAAEKPDDWSEPDDQRDTRYGSGIIDVPATVVEIEGPAARFAVDQSPPVVNQTTTFDAGNSTGQIQKYEWDFDGDGTVEQTTSDPVVNRTFTDPGERTVSLTVTDTEGRNGTVTRTLSVSPPPLADDPPRDLDGDGLYEDVRGDGNLTILDVQSLFNNLDTPDLQEYATLYSFSEDDPQEVSILDVQGLFNRLSS
jgi:subtilisin family serine protease